MHSEDPFVPAACVVFTIATRAILKLTLSV